MDAGRRIVEGIWQGISAGTEWIYDKISGWVGDVVQFIKNKLGIASPSKVMAAQVGVWLPRGIWAGWEQEMPKVNSLIANSINTTFDLPGIRVNGRASGSGGYSAGGRGVTVNIYAKQITQADMDMIVDTVNRELGGDMP